MLGHWYTLLLLSPTAPAVGEREVVRLDSPICTVVLLDSPITPAITLASSIDLELPA